MKKGLKILGIIFVTGLIANLFENKGSIEKLQAGESQTIKLNSIEDYKKSIPGKYSNCESDDFGMGKMWDCLMLDISDDGKYTYYEGEYIGTGGYSNLSQYKWVEEANGTWDIYKGEYSDTGKEYFALEVQHQKHYFVIDEFFVLDYKWILTKNWAGDKINQISMKFAIGGNTFNLTAGDRLSD